MIYQEDWQPCQIEWWLVNLYLSFGNYIWNVKKCQFILYVAWNLFLIECFENNESKTVHLNLSHEILCFWIIFLMMIERNYFYYCLFNLVNPNLAVPDLSSNILMVCTVYQGIVRTVVFAFQKNSTFFLSISTILKELWTADSSHICRLSV